MRLEVPNFSGMRPRTADKLLPSHEATAAEDCRIYSGELRPLRKLDPERVLNKPGPIKSIYLYADQFWFHWGGDVDVIGSLVPNDTTSRVFWTGDGYPKQSDATLATSGGLTPGAPTHEVIAVSGTNPVKVTLGGSLEDGLPVVEHGYQVGDKVYIALDFLGFFGIVNHPPEEMNAASVFFEEGELYGYAEYTVSGVVSPTQFEIDLDGSALGDYERALLGSLWFKCTQTAVAGVEIEGLFPGRHLRLGLPAPATAPILDVAPFNEDTENETRIYVYTYVTGWGEEGPPSPPSTPITCDVDATVEVMGFAAPPASHMYDIRRIRLYRLATGTDASEFFLVNDEEADPPEIIPQFAMGFIDSKLSHELLEPLETEGWDAPPEDLQGLTALANGVLAGFVGNDIYFTPNYVPYAWPRAYMVSVPHKVVGLGSFGTDVVVLTEGNPYIASGVDPSAVTLSKIDIPQACVSKRSIANLGAEGVAFATPDGLALVGPGGFDLPSQEFMTQEEWRKYNPSSIVAAAHDSAYVAFFERENGDKGGFIFDQANGFRELSFHATAMHADMVRDKLYLADGNDLYAFDEGDEPLPSRWKSKLFETPPTSFALGRVVNGPRTEGDALTLNIYADGALLHTQAIPDSNQFRLPPALSGARTWQIELIGDVPVQEVSLASSSAELKQ